MNSRLYLFLIVFFFALTFQLSAQNEDKGIIFFKGTWEEVLAEATKKKKPIFVDAYTSWCGPCKKMASQVFPLEEVGRFYNKNYVCYKMDMEKGEGPTFAVKYKVKSYPTFLYLDSEGKVLHRIVGGRKPNDFITEARKGLFDEKSLTSMEKEYNEGKRDKEFMQKYVQTLMMAESPAYNRVSSEYFSSLSKTELLAEDNMDLIYSAADRITSKPFKLMLENRASFEETFGKEAVAQKIVESAIETLPRASEKKDEKLFDQIISTLKSSNHEKSGEMVEQVSLKFYSETADWKKYSKSALNYDSNFDVIDPGMLNSMAWNFYLHVSSKKYLEKALSWAEKSVELKSSYANNDTKAAVLQKLGRRADALVAAEKAISIAKMEKKDYKSTEDLIDKILED